MKYKIYILYVLLYINIKIIISNSTLYETISTIYYRLTITILSSKHAF